MARQRKPIEMQKGNLTVLKKKCIKKSMSEWEKTSLKHHWVW